MAAKDADVAVHNSAAQKAQALLEQVKAGADFAELARQNSEDSGSAARGGELGFFQRGDMVPEFEQAAFALQNVGDLSSVVKTNYGYHILQLIAVEAAQIPAFEKVRDIMAMELKSELAMKQYTQAVEQLKTISYEQADSLEPAAKALNLVVQQSPLMTRNSGEGIFASPNVVEAMFSATVVKEKMNSAVIEPQAGEAIVMRLNRYQPEYEKSFAEVKADIQQLVARKEAIAMAAAYAKTVLSEVKKPTVDPVMQVKEGIEWKSPEWMSRNEAKVLPEVISAAFKAPKPKTDQMTWVSHQLSTGDTVLIRLSGVRQDDAKIKQIEGELKQAAQQVFSDAMLDAVTNAIRQKVDVEILLK
jgi:peptidyl-prolyl cis-trans isomerase D